MKNIIAIDTSSTELSVCLSSDGVILSSVCRYVKNSHAEHITQAVTTALALGGVGANDVTHVAISTGPGSFTGLRIGLAFAKGFCTMTSRRVLPLSSLLVLAHAAGFRGDGDKKIFVALDARQGLIHWASFEWSSQKKLRRLSDDNISDPKILLDKLNDDDILITDTMGYSRSTVFEMFADKCQTVSVQDLNLDRARSCAALAFEKIEDESLWQDANGIVPDYLQPPAAIVAIERKAS